MKSSLKNLKDKSFLLSALVFVLCGLWSFTFAQPAHNIKDFIEVEDAYVRGLPASVKNTSAYMTIINHSEQDVSLTGASSTIAESIMLHRTSSDGGMMNMHHMMAITVPAKGKVVLESGAMHLMVMGLKSPLNSGDEVGLSLAFDGGRELAIKLPVLSVLDE